jgi:hypothetical protein
MAQLIAVSLLIFFVVGQRDVRALEAPPPSSEARMQVQGEITDIRSGMISVKTPTANYTLSQKVAPLNAKVGDKVTLWMNPHSAVIDLHRQGTHQRHRFITGTLLRTQNAQQQITLWTPEGNKVFPINGPDLTIQDLADGTMVTVEVNEAGRVIDLHRVEAEEASCDKRHHCKVMVHGTVTAIESGMMFIRTPVVEYELQANAAPRDAVLGDEMTIWVNENNIVLDQHRTGDTRPHRFITGTLTYVGNGRNKIKLWTPEGEKIFSLGQVETKSLTLKERRPVTVEINDAGVVIDLWQSS